MLKGEGNKMNKYHLNLNRLVKGRKFISLALKSGTLRDVDWELASNGEVIGALHLLDDAIKRQQNYIDSRATN